MPRFLEQKLRAEYGAHSAIPYKVMNARGYMRGNKETAAGRALQAKHNRDAGLKASHASHPNASRLGKFLHPKKGY